MEKETLLAGLKKELGEPAANGYLGDTGVTIRTLEKYAEALLPTISSDDVANDGFYKAHAEVVKAMGGQMRFEQAEFVKSYKPNKNHDTGNPPNHNEDELYDDFKRRLDALEKEREDDRKTFAIEKMRSELLSKSVEFNVSNKPLWDDVVRQIAYVDGMDAKAMEAKAKDDYECKLKSYFGDGVSPYGGDGGFGGGDDKSLESFFQKKIDEGKFPGKK